MTATSPVLIASEFAAPVDAASIEDAGAVERSLALAQRLVAASEAFALQLDRPELGQIELPPSVGSAADKAILQSVAPLYLACELEATRLLPAVEMLAGLFASGGLAADVGAAAELLVAFRQARRDRFTAAERQAIFARLFGATAGPTLATDQPRNTAFEPLMIDLSEALYRVGADPRLGAQSSTTVRVQVAASQLVANLIPRGGGITSFAARELLGSIQKALAILKHALVQQAVGARSVWDAVRNITRQYLREPESEIAVHVTRGKAGLLVLGWLAEVLPRLDDLADRLVSPDDSAPAAALAWLQASLALHERTAPASEGG